MGLSSSDAQRGGGSASAPPASPQLGVQDAVAGGWHSLRLTGELDLVTAPLLGTAVDGIAMAEIDGVTLDLSKLTFMDSTGLRAVLALADRCAETRSELRIVPGPHAVQRVFEVTGLGARLSFAPAPLPSG